MLRLVALWFAVLQALVAAPTLRAGVGPTASAVACATGAVSPAGALSPQDAPRTARMVRSATGPLHEALRAAAPVTGLLALSAERSPTHVPTLGTLATAPRPTGEAVYAANVRARTLEASHAVAVRGAVLPYFPTAPPLQG